MNRDVLGILNKKYESYLTVRELPGKIRTKENLKLRENEIEIWEKMYLFIYF